MTESEPHNHSILHHFDIADLSPALQEKLSVMSLDAYYREYDGMQEFMTEVVSPDSDPETRLDFEDEGYDLNYGTEEMGFYDLGPRPQVIYQTLEELNEKGIDTTEATEVFHEIAGSVWKNAPKYYETRPEAYKVKTPEDYDPQVPYPQILQKKKTGL